MVFQLSAMETRSTASSIPTAGDLSQKFVERSRDRCGPGDGCRPGCQLLLERSGTPTVVDLVAGSGLEFERRGSHQLEGVPGTWQLFSLAS
jgi:hypothetical protein